MEVLFSKYEGAGNDFILCDDRGGEVLPLLDRATIARWCDRHFGIGADGLMLLRRIDAPYDFEMLYYNSDGRSSTMCGNGGRCIVRFAADLGIEREVYRFLAVDGGHAATLLDDGDVSLGMRDVYTLREVDDGMVIDTGSPHYLRFVEHIDDIDVVAEGRAIRRSAPYAKDGINVNFVAFDDATGGLAIATYERGVENETLACGTGVTAAAIAHVSSSNRRPGMFSVPVRARGGRLRVEGVCKAGGRFTDLRLIGPARKVFTGTIEV